MYVYVCAYVCAPVSTSPITADCLCTCMDVYVRMWVCILSVSATCELAADSDEEQLTKVEIKSRD